jgi:hypothetical protein
MFSLIVEAMSHLLLALKDMLLFKEMIGTRRVGNGTRLVLFLSHEKRVQRVLVEIS